MEQNKTIGEMVEAAQKPLGAAPDEAMDFLAKYLERHRGDMDQKDRQAFIQAGATIWLLWQT